MKDRWTRLLARESYDWKEPNEIVVRLSDHLPKGAKMLDLGCGRGRHIAYLAKLGYDVIGADISLDVLGLCQNRLLEEDVDNTRLVNCSMDSLPFSSNSFDAVVCTNTLHHGRLCYIEGAVHEIYRVLRVDGLCAVTIASTKNDKYQKGRKIESGTYIVNEDGVQIAHHFFTGDEARKTFKDFKLIEIYEDADMSKEGSSGHWYLLAKRSVR